MHVGPPCSVNKFDTCGPPCFKYTGENTVCILLHFDGSLLALLHNMHACIDCYYMRSRMAIA